MSFAPPAFRRGGTGYAGMTPNNVADSPASASTAPAAAVNPASIKLSANEKDCLVKMATSHGQRLSISGVEKHDPPRRALNALVKKGLANAVSANVWEITEMGRQRCTSIY